MKLRNIRREDEKVKVGVSSYFFSSWLILAFAFPSLSSFVYSVYSWEFDMIADSYENLFLSALKHNSIFCFCFEYSLLYF